MKNKLRAKRHRRNISAFEQILHDASPAMRQELIVMAQHNNLVR